MTGTACWIGIVLLLAGAGGAAADPLSQGDRALMDASLSDALENTRPNEITVWENPKTGNFGTVRPRDRYRNSDGQSCRGYDKKTVTDGREQRIIGAACVGADGKWQIVPPQELPMRVSQHTVIAIDRVVYQTVVIPYLQPPRWIWWASGHPVWAVQSLHRNLEQRRYRFEHRSHLGSLGARNLFNRRSQTFASWRSR
jgi:surface antigen